jgi:hypothetical protein
VALFVLTFSKTDGASVAVDSKDPNIEKATPYNKTHANVNPGETNEEKMDPRMMGL